MAVLVEQDAEEKRDHNAYGDESVHQATGITEREVAEEGQEQEEAPVDLHVDAERASYLERSTHNVEFTPRSDNRCDPTLPARIEGWRNAPLKVTVSSRQGRTLPPSRNRSKARKR